MASSLLIRDLDAYYRSITTKIVVNDLKYFSAEDIGEVNRNILTVYEGSEIKELPSCTCGKYQANYLDGITCPICGTVCTKPYDEQPVLWLRAFKNDEDTEIKFINPVFWLQLRALLDKDKKYDYLRYLADRKYRAKLKSDDVYIKTLVDIIGGRGYLNLVNNLDKVIGYLKEQPKFKVGEKLEKLDALLNIWENTNVLSTYLPILNKRLFVLEKAPKGQFTNFTLSENITVVKNWMLIGSTATTKARDLENATAAAISSLASMYYEYLAKYTVVKRGLFRKHLYSARSHFTARTVITAIAGPHQHNSLELPWSIGVTLLRPHLMNRLVKRGYNYNEVTAKLNRAVKRYDNEINEIFLELISESRYRGLPVILQRNPSLQQSSALLLFIDKIKTDVGDYTFGISGLITKGPHADFDGDEMNLTLLLDNMMAELAETFSPYYNIVDMSGKPKEICGNLTLLSPTSATISRWLRDRKDGIAGSVDLLLKFD